VGAWERRGGVSYLSLKRTKERREIAHHHPDVGQFP